jgi:N-acylglucosamine-6-phosphate 2-epimerase
MSSAILGRLRQSVIVSVQAEHGEPFYKPECLLAMAISAINGGAKGLRLANPENIRFIKEHLPEIPVIGITKPSHPHPDPENQVYITPSLWTAESVAQSGAEIIAMDATLRPRPSGEPLSEIVSCLRGRFPDRLLMADIATLEEGENAEKLGFDLVGTTLSGYTAETLSNSKDQTPDFDLLAALVKALSLPIIMEGRIWFPTEVSRAFELGAHAVVIGSAVTRPHLITKRFVQAIPSLKGL